MEEVNILFIGDPHVKADNIPESDLLINDIISKIKNIKPDLCIIGGDLMHYHEKLYTIPLNKAYEFVKRCSYEVPTYVLVGNHDMINNQQFLTENHWMNGMKTWKEDVHIIDKVEHISLKNHNFVLCPYVYPGRFVEALDTIKEQFDWKDSNIIFAHQEFKGCKMGAITSIEGDDWNEEYPMVISGHIHNKQKPQKNIFYPGSSMQQAFGESENNIIINVKIKNNEIEIEELELNLPKKKIINIDVSKLDDFKIKENTPDKIRLTITGDYDEFKTFKKTEKYKELNDKGVKVVFRHKKNKNVEVKHELKDVVDFSNILNNLVSSSKNVNLVRAYEYIINNKKLKQEDIFFL
jgi:DNA repair exonuclease SbcCD nuclease subunit